MCRYHQAERAPVAAACKVDGCTNPSAGKGGPWARMCQQHISLEVARRQAVRHAKPAPLVDPVDLLDEPDGMTTDEHVLRHLADEEALEDAANHVSENEFAALRLVLTAGYSYAEAAEVIFGDAAMTKQVDGLLTRGKRKLAAAWDDRRPSPRGAGGSNVPDRTDDKEETDG